jgi:hypothetical protein
MRKITIGALLLAQTAVAVQPAGAASLHDQDIASRQSVGAFAGARLRLSLDGPRRKASAGLAFAPVQRSTGNDGRAAYRFGEGVAFGSVNGAAPSLQLAGKPDGSTQARLGQDNEDDDKGGGISTLGIAAIVLGVAAIGAFAAFVAIADANTE